MERDSKLYCKYEKINATSGRIVILAIRYAFILTYTNNLTAMIPRPIPEPGPDLYTEEEVSKLVHEFYAKARKDAALGPIFEEHVIDWDAHFVQMTNFWSAQLRGTSRFRGAPMPKHIALPELSDTLFKRWLQLFRQTTQEMDNPLLKQHADAVAEFIAGRLWMGYQMSHFPHREPAVLDTSEV
ncbi:group III truncated hemoglobin [uncultured Nitrosomonas sp.]|uniref:group III truncated hemoglobin n=1 Tax=uncultured Nitrosomonas sp. TaxID=156424 RepID=UPI003441C31F